MSKEIANQLLVRVQNEMVRNIAAVKKQLIEWLERPESGGVDTFAEQLSEVSGGLALLSRNNAAQLCTVLADGVKTLDVKFRDKTIGQHEFSEIGAEIASGLILLNDYIERLASIEPTDERSLSEAIQAIESMLEGNGVVKIAAQPRIDRETYQALSAKVSEVLETSRNQIEQYGVHADKHFDAATLIGHNKNLISLFEVLNLKAPQLLLNHINHMLSDQLSEQQWIDIAEAMILVEDILEHVQVEEGQNLDYSAAVSEQSHLSRNLEIQKLLHDTGNLASRFYEGLRKQLTADEKITPAQHWQEASANTLHFAAVSHLVGEKPLAGVLNQMALQFAEISLRAHENHQAQAYPTLIDVLVAGEYIFSDLGDTARINPADVTYLKQVADNLGKFYPVSEAAKKLLVEFARHEAAVDEAELAKEGDLSAGLDDLLHGLDALEEHFDGVLSEAASPAEQEAEEELPTAVAVVGEAGVGDAPAEQPYQAYFAGKSLADLSALQVPQDKENFLASSDAAVMDEEIREFFLEELAEKIQEIAEKMPSWQANPYDEAALSTIRRAFHTIKGSGRTVGYEALGECAWQHEQMLNRLLDKSFSVNPTLQGLVSDTVDLLKILTAGSGFVEQQAALLTQASLAEQLTDYLSKHPDADEQAIARHANALRQALTDGAGQMPAPSGQGGAAAQAGAERGSSDTGLTSFTAAASVAGTQPSSELNAEQVSGLSIDEPSVAQDAAQVQSQQAAATHSSDAAEIAAQSSQEISSVSAPVGAAPSLPQEQGEAQDHDIEAGLEFSLAEGDEAVSSAADADAAAFETPQPEQATDDVAADAQSVEFSIAESSEHTDEVDDEALQGEASAIETSLPVSSAAAALADTALDDLNVLADELDETSSAENDTAAAFRPFYADKTLSDLAGLGGADAPAAEAPVDEDLLSIFLEELDSNVEQIDKTLPKWKQYPQNKEHLSDVRRAFHTIKGSGKMVGYQTLGDFAWQYENLLNAIADAYIQTNNLVLSSVEDASGLLKILRTEDGFIEHKPALDMQGSVAGQIRERLLANPEMSTAEQAELAEELYSAFAAKAGAQQDTAPDQGEAAPMEMNARLTAEAEGESQSAVNAALHAQQNAPPAAAEHEVSALAAELGQMLDSGLQTIDIDDEEEKSLLREILAEKIAQQELQFSPQQLAALSAQLSSQLAAQLDAAQLADLLPFDGKGIASQGIADEPLTDSVSLSTSHTDASADAAAYRHIAAMLQRSLAAQPLDADDEAVLAAQLQQELAQIGATAEDAAQREAVQAKLSSAFSGDVADSAAFDELVANLLAQSDAAKIDAADEPLTDSASLSTSHSDASADAAAYRHIAAMLQRSLAAQPLDADDEAVLAAQLQQELAQIGAAAEDAAQREAVQAKLLSAFSGDAADSTAFDELVANLLDKAGTAQADAAEAQTDGLDEAVLQRLVATVSRMDAAQADSDDAEILRRQIQAAIADYARSPDQHQAIEAAVEAHLRSAFAQQSQASALLDEVFADAEAAADPFAALDSVYEENEEAQAAENAAPAETDAGAGIDSADDKAAAATIADESFIAADQAFAEDALSFDAGSVEMAADEADDEQLLPATAQSSFEGEEVALDPNTLAALLGQHGATEQPLTAEAVEDLSFDHEADGLDEEAGEAGAGLIESHLSTAPADIDAAVSADMDADEPLRPSLSSANAPKAHAGAKRLSDELAKISDHPSLNNAVGAPVAASAAGFTKFLSAVDTFESLSHQVEENHSPEMIDNLIESVYDIEDSLEVGSVPDWIWRMLDAIEQLLLTHRSQGSPISLNVASVLRQSVDLIEHFDEEESAEHADQTINTLMQTRKELGAAHVAAQSASLPETAPMAGAAPAAQHWDEWIPDPNAGTDIADIFLDEALSLLGRSQAEAEHWDNDRSNLTHLDMIQRDMHTLKGGARMSGYLALGDLTHAIESMIQSIVNGHSQANNQAVAILNGALWQAMIMLDAVRDGFLPQTDPYILNNINRFLELPLPYPEVAEQEARLREASMADKGPGFTPKTPADDVLQAAAEPVPAVAEEAQEAPAAFDENIDPVLVDIFTDEAQELISQTEELFGRDLKNQEVIEELKRTMHTLKGAARLVGLTAIGDTSHLMESVIEQLPDYNEAKMRQAKNLLNMGHEALYGMLDSVLRKEMPVPAAALNESLRIFAKEGRFVQPEAPTQAVQSDSKAGAAAAVQPSQVQTAGEAAPVQAESSQVRHTEAAAPAADEAEKLAVDPARQAGTGGAAPAADLTDSVSQPAAASGEAAPDGAAEQGEPAQAEPPKAEAATAEAAKPEPAEADKPAVQHADIQRYVRVNADVLDEMIAMVGETAIMRSRLENVSSESAFNLNELTRIANRIDEQMRRLDNETEAQMLFRREAQGADDEHFDPLEMDRFSEIQQLSRQLSEAINDLKNVQETLSSENSLIRNLSIQQGFIQRGIQDRLLTTQLVRFDVNEARLKRLVRQTAKSVDKDIELIIEGGHVELERRLIDDVLPAIEHMIRNSVGHGIESPRERLAAGKAAQGTIKLSVAARASNVEIRILDDGRGFDYARIREKARSKGWLDENRADDVQYLNSLLMRSGFSTAQSITQLSGRGVGMDVVSEMVKQRRGQLLAESIPGKGAQFTILMPFTMSIAEVLLVEVAEQIYAVPMNAIAAIAQVPQEYLQRSHAGEEAYAQYDEMDYRLYILGDYFNPQDYQFSVDTATAPALFINASGEPTAFHVDRIANRVEVIVKNVNRQVLNIPGISGATILGDGNVVPVLEPLDLAHRIGGLRRDKEEAPAEEAYVPNILVVDDSVTMRKVSTRLLERNGYVVASAKDGLDAIDTLQHFTPDLILLDIEMPRMDGFEFASHVRQNSQVPEVPIIMITSRTGDKHRERADQIGVQGYLGKPYREDILIEIIDSLLGDKAHG